MRRSMELYNRTRERESTVRLRKETWRFFTGEITQMPSVTATNYRPWDRTRRGTYAGQLLSSFQLLMEEWCDVTSKTAFTNGNWET